MVWSPAWVFAYWIAARSEPRPLSPVFVTISEGASACEYSEVFPFGSVAVAVKTSWLVGAGATVALKVALPETSVVTVVWPR